MSESLFIPPEKPVTGWLKMEYEVIGGLMGMHSNLISHEKFPAESEVTFTIVKAKGRKYYQINEKQKLFCDQVLDETALVEIGQSLKLCSHKLQRFSPEGKEIEKWEVDFNEPSWKYPQNTFNKTSIPLVMASFMDQHLNHDVKETSFYFWLNDQQTYKMFLKVQGKERIKTKMGGSTHVRMKMVPDVKSIMPVGKSLAPLIQPLMPGVHIWDSEDRTKYSMRIEGMIGPPGSPKMRAEIVDYKMDA